MPPANYGEVETLLRSMRMPPFDAPRDVVLADLWMQYQGWMVVLGNFQTMGGFVMMFLGRIPNVSDHFEAGGLRFEVVDMDKNRVDKILVLDERSGADGAAKPVG